MLGTIKPNRTEVSRSFPVAGFTIRTGMNPAWFEVALTTDPHLLHPENREHRTPHNFYSSRSAGPLPAHGGEAVYLVPPTVLSRFAGQDRLYYAVAIFASADRSNPQVLLSAPEATPYVSISRSFSGQALRQMIGVPNHRGGLASDGYGEPAPDTMTWSGDDAAPGSSHPVPPPMNHQAASGMPSANNGPSSAKPIANGNTAPSMNADRSAAQSYDVPYDDGFGTDFWAKPMDAPAIQDDDNRGIEGPIPDDSPQTQTIAQSYALARLAPEYPGASRFEPAHTNNYRVSSGQRNVDLIVIHITDGGPKIDGTIGWFQTADQQIKRKDGTIKHITVSAHYIVGTDGEVVQTVANNNVAWHASQVNGHSIGIEHTANKSRNILPTDAEYCASAALVNWLCQQYSIPMDRDHIKGHNEASPRDGHTDCPDSVWDWDYYMGLVTSSSCYPRDAAPAQEQSYAASLASATNGYPKTQHDHNGNGHNGHNGNRHGTQPQHEQGSMARTAAYDVGEPFDINWDDAQLVGQPNGMSCWAASAAMVVGWNKRFSMDPTALAMMSGDWAAYTAGLNPSDRATLAKTWGLAVEPPQDYTVDGFRRLLENYGPLWVGVAVPSGHAVVVTGMVSDGTYEGTYVHINDPWPPGKGVKSTLSYQRFMEEYDNRMTTNSAGDVNVQILHATGTDGRKIGQGRGASTSQGYAGSLGRANSGYPTPSRLRAATLADIAPMDAPSDPVALLNFMVQWQGRKTSWKAGVPDTTIFPHSAICHFEMTYPDGLYAGTGFYIGTNTILTCAHNVIDWDTKNEASQIVITPGLNGAGNAPFGKFTVQRAAWDYHPKYDGTRSFDLAVIRVDTPAPNGLYFSTLEELTQSKPSPIIVCGYAAKSVDAHKQHLDSDMIRTVEDETFEYNLQTEPGNSGSPVFYVDVYEDDERKQSVQEIKIVGVHVAGYDASLNRGCRLTDAKIGWINDTANKSKTASAASLGYTRTPIMQTAAQRAASSRYGKHARTAALADTPDIKSAAGGSDATMTVSLKEPDYSVTPALDDPEQPAIPAPTATLDHAAMYHLIREVAKAHSGNDGYAAISADAEAAANPQKNGSGRHFGLGFGLLLFSQESGHLGSILKLMQQRDAAAFASTFGPQADALLGVTNANTPEERLKPVDNAALWNEPWLTRFRQAGANPAFQAAQNEEAIEQMFRPLLNVLFALGITSDRGLAMALDRAVTRGVGGAIDWIVQSCGPLRTFQHRNYALDLAGVDSVHEVQSLAGWTPQDGNFGPETHAALVGILREQGLIPLPTPADYEARMLAAATGAVLIRLQRLRDSAALNGTVFRL